MLVYMHRGRILGQEMKKLALLLLWAAMPCFAQSHSVDLAWGASPDAAANPTLSYNVYRSQTSCAAATTFTKINSTAAGSLAFTDSSVAVGNTYCYQVTAVLNGLESIPSPQAQAVILPSASPSLTATPH